jgi:hypothetical protein
MLKIIRRRRMVASRFRPIILVVLRRMPVATRRGASGLVDVPRSRMRAFLRRVPVARISFLRVTRYRGNFSDNACIRIAIVQRYAVATGHAGSESRPSLHCSGERALEGGIRIYNVRFALRYNSKRRKVVLCRSISSTTTSAGRCLRVCTCIRDCPVYYIVLSRLRFCSVRHSNALIANRAETLSDRDRFASRFHNAFIGDCGKHDTMIRKCTA